MLIGNEHDLAALRAGIAEQERRRIEAENIQRSFDREIQKPYVPQRNVAFRRVDQLRPGDQFIEVSAGEYFKAAEVIEKVEFADDGSRPYIIQSRTLPGGGTCRRARTGDTLFLIGRE